MPPFASFLSNLLPAPLAWTLRRLPRIRRQLENLYDQARFRRITEITQEIR
jgi:hypothetical protein